MTALERAKAFVNSRAAKTALKIMPLALATVATVTVTAPKAHADVALNPTKVYFQACTSNDPSVCCGGFVLDTATTTTNDPGAALGTDGGVNGALGSGTANGYFGAPKTDPVDFFLSGDGTGSNSGLGGKTLTIDWEIDATAPSIPDFSVVSTNVFFHVQDGLPFDENCGADFGDDTFNGVYTGLVKKGSCQFTVDPGVGIPTQWYAEIELQLNSDTDATHNDNVNWKVSYLTVTANGYPPTTGVPEPASMLLALSGLPLIGTLIRRKR